MNYSSEYCEVEYLTNIRKNEIKAKKSPLKLEKQKTIEGNGANKYVKNLFTKRKCKTKEIKGNIVKK